MSSTAQSEGGAQPDRRGTILVVEDDAEIRSSLKDVLEYEGYSVATATNGLDALARLGEIGRPSLILLDLMMPVMSGREFLVELRQSEAMSDVSVVVVSAWPDAAREVPVQGVVAKPMDLDRLLGVVAQYC
jgi:CheY-like chemotaxis protein